MTKRYFYTDPLAAAWMAEHFGMEYLPDTLVDNKRGTIAAPRLMVHLTGFSPRESVTISCPSNSAMKFYIHPDSLHLLEPQISDRDENGFVWDGVKWQCPFRLLVSDGSRIIQRNGKPFMMPECEEA